jgi:hypothetical protein
LKGQKSFCKGAAGEGGDIYSRYWFPCCFRLCTDPALPPPAVSIKPDLQRTGR